MPAERNCSQCGAPLPANAPGNRCPKCLLKLALYESAVERGSPEPHQTRTAAPEKTAALPQSGVVIEKTGMMIGRYKLLQQIGEGGFGIVFMAEQAEPVQRKVALKVIKAGMDTREIIARFEAERQALALMDHPNIAQVLDGGATASGRPYFVMELVKGVPITDFCDHANLSTRERLELFIKVCRAVQHAHQKGVIHRDLKPSNVLVTLHDGEPVPKVIDFGVAKALGQKLTDKTCFTRFEQMIGTPAYMSPEQAALSGLDVDTRSDIYSLGVLLYELLTGVTPLDAETLRKAALDEIRRMIQETEPPKPSTRLVSLGDRLADIAKCRHAEPSSLTRLVRGDLDWITMKALEKDRRRRYETVNGLMMDIERHLNSEPVTACPPSALYRLQKTVRRHRIAFATSTAIALALVLGVITSTWQAVRATRAEHEQFNLRVKAQKAQADADEQRKRAEKNAEESRRLLAQYADALYGEAWEYAVGQHEPHAPEEALPLILKALEVSPANVAYLTGLAEVYFRLGREKESLATYDRAIELNPTDWRGYQQLAWHHVTGRAGSHAPEKARPFALKAVELTKAQHYGSLNTLGLIYSRLGLRAEAITLFERSVQLAPEKIYGRMTLAWLYITGPKASRAPNKALPLALQAVTLTHTNIYETLNTLGVVYSRLGQHDKAVATLEIGIHTPGSDGGSAADYYSLAESYYRLGETVKADTFYHMGRMAVERGDTLLHVGQLADAETFRAEVEELLGKRSRSGPAAPEPPATNVVTLTQSEANLLKGVRDALAASTVGTPK